MTSWFGARSTLRERPKHSVANVFHTPRPTHSEAVLFVIVLSGLVIQNPDARASWTFIRNSAPGSRTFMATHPVIVFRRSEPSSRKNAWPLMSTALTSFTETPQVPCTVTARFSLSQIELFSRK
jgi:hypothetical protein